MRHRLHILIQINGLNIYVKNLKVHLSSFNRFFLIGLRKYGKGHWTDISRNVVRTKSPIQVASHVKKISFASVSLKKRKRKSIHVPRGIDQQNYIPTPDFSMQQQQLLHQEQDMPHLNPPNNMSNQMTEFIYFNNNF